MYSVKQAHMYSIDRQTMYTQPERVTQMVQMAKYHH